MTDWTRHRLQPSVARLRRAALAPAAVVCALMAIAGCAKQPPEATGAQREESATPVLVADAVRKDMPVILRAIGRVTPTHTVMIKPMVTGQVAAVHFEDGRDVAAGDLLFTIDRRPFEAALDEARAVLAQAKTQAENATVQERRYQALTKGGAVPQVFTIQSRGRLTNAADFSQLPWWCS